jgi:hypothetical protein
MVYNGIVYDLWRSLKSDFFAFSGGAVIKVGILIRYPLVQP